MFLPFLEEWGCVPVGAPFPIVEDCLSAKVLGFLECLDRKTAAEDQDDSALHSGGIHGLRQVHFDLLLVRVQLHDFEVADLAFGERLGSGRGRGGVAFPAIF